jgi:cell division protein FtsB
MRIRRIHIILAAVTGVLAISFLGYMILYGDGGWYKLNAMKQELTDIETQNQRIENENIRIYRKIDRLKNDPEYVKNAAKQELKLIGEGEIVFTTKHSD